MRTLCVLCTVCVLGQEPTLFSGTLRKNLDPLGKYTDDDIWRALDRVALKSVLEARSEGLETPVIEGGA